MTVSLKHRWDAARYHPAGWMISAASRYWREAPAVFVISTGRTGTVSLISLCQRSDDLLAAHEPKPRLLEAHREAYAQVRRRPAHFWRMFSQCRRAALADARLRGKVYVEATTFKCFAPVIAEHMPRSRFIHMCRHPAGVVRSCMRRGTYRDHRNDRYRTLPRPDDPAHAMWDQWGPFEKICWMWKAEHEFFLELEDELGPQRVVRLPFEDFVDVDCGAYRRVFELANVPAPSEDVAREMLAEPRNAQSTGEFPEYDQWTPEQRETLWRIAGPVMRRLGYTE